jgi:hypothetical protein
MLSYGQCKQKIDAATPDKVYYQDIFVINENDKNTKTNVFLISGLINDPFNFLHDAIQKAYELGAPYKKAKITIKMKKGYDSSNNARYYHYMKVPTATQEIYIPSKYINDLRFRQIGQYIID